MSWLGDLFSKCSDYSSRHCMVALDNGNVVMLGGHGHGYDVTMFDFEIEEWVKLANLTFYSDRYLLI